MHRLHNHAFYLYGVIVGLAIREVLVRVGQHVFVSSTPSIEPWKIHLEALRLVIFLMTISVFYFGSGVFFNRVHLNPETAETFKKKSYGLDFVGGLIHFLIFFAWAIAITDHSRYTLGASLFLVYLGAIFLYDLIWLLVSIPYDSVREIKLWALMCTVVFFLATGLFLGVRTWKNNDVIAEEACFIIYFLYLLGDAVELFTERPFFSELIRWFLPEKT